MKLSVVATLYNTGPWLAEFHRRVTAVAGKLYGDFEIVLVNDGSPDNALDLAVALSAADPRVVVVDLSRNFGHHKAIMVGLSAARGDHVFLIDSDLEEPPECLEAFDAALQETQADVAFGYQVRRRGHALGNISGQLYYWLVNLLADIKLHPNLVTARLMTRRYVTSLLRHREREMFISGLWAITGYKQVGVPVTKGRNAPSSYTVGKRLGMLVTSIISFSEKPLVLAALLGASISGSSFLGIIYLFFRRLAQQRAVPGWASIVVSIWFVGGLVIFFLGLIGIYISKIFVEVKQRPYAIVRDVFRGGSSIAADNPPGQNTRPFGNLLD